MSESASDSEFRDLERGDSEGKLLGGAKTLCRLQKRSKCTKGGLGLFEGRSGEILACRITLYVNKDELEFPKSDSIYSLTGLEFSFGWT